MFQLTRYKAGLACSVIILFMMLSMPGAVRAAPKDVAPRNVILVTLDGVRSQDFFAGKAAPPNFPSVSPNAYFRRFWTKYSKESFIIGNRVSGPLMSTGNANQLSLPGYQAIYAGFNTGCRSNRCGQIQYETFPERLIREKVLAPEEVAVIASWKTMDAAVERVPGTFFVNTGATPLVDHVQDPLLDAINQRQAVDFPSWSGARRDVYTHDHALRYLNVHRPRFMMIGYLDGDQWAHKFRGGKYRATLRTYDLWLEELFDTLKGMGEYGKNTTVIVTVDHGRGGGLGWSQHGKFFKGSYSTWMLAYGAGVRPLEMSEGTSRSFTLKDIRPSIEAIFGLKPISCKECGHAIPEIVGAGRSHE